MGILIDSSVIIDAERGRLDLDQRTSGRVQDCFLSAITASELLFGLHRAIRPDIHARRSAYIEHILDLFSVIPVDLAVARIHAQVSASLSLKGIIVAPHDLWIAATCLACGHSIATANIRDFSRVPGLSVEHWG
jgi:tRNA(fMet)-specific endonuclease VapC